MSPSPSSRTVLTAALAVAIAAAAAAGGAVLTPAGPALAQAPRDQGAEQFVQTEGQRAVAILADRSVGPAERIRRFRALVDNVADVPRIMRFVLGKYARNITPEQMQRFAAVFRVYEQNVYQRQLSEFHGGALSVTGSMVRKPGDVVVATTVSSSGSDQPTQVYWRVLESGGGWKVVDVQVAGVWLAITQQQDFVSTIDNHGGDIDALIAQLQKMVQQRTALPVRDR